MWIVELFRPRWKHEDPKVRLEAVKNLVNSAKLAELAKSDRSFDVREAAIQKLADQTVLADIARSAATSDPLRVLAAERLVDQVLGQSVIACLAQSSCSGPVRLHAATKVVDKALSQKLLGKIAREETGSTAGEAMQLIVDPQVLAEIASDAATDLCIRRAAIEKIPDPVLLEFARATEESWFAAKIIERVADVDEATLVTLARRLPDAISIVVRAVAKTSDQAFLGEVCRSKGQLMYIARQAAVKKLEDQALLVQISHDHEEESLVRIGAVARIRDKDCLVQLATDRHLDLREAVALALGEAGPWCFTCKGFHATEERKSTAVHMSSDTVCANCGEFLAGS